MGKIFDYDGVPVLHTTSGDLKGYFYDGVYIYKGIPYAYADRFQMPVPSKWDGVKDATNYGFVCPLQNQDTPNGELMVPHRYWPQDEHCQSLNIWTSKLDPEAKKPVLVWFHGGGYAAGSSIEQVAYDGVSIAKKGDSILVSVNHRLNILGYLDLSPFGEKYKNSANAGHADMVAALQWVHDNIALFGGDPENVTIFGQSGGGMKVIDLMQIPSADGLFQKGLVMSGVMEGDPLGAGEKDGTEIVTAMMKELGFDDVAQLETVPYPQLAAAYAKVSPAIAQNGGDIGGGGDIRIVQVAGAGGDGEGGGAGILLGHEARQHDPCRHGAGEGRQQQHPQLPRQRPQDAEGLDMGPLQALIVFIHDDPSFIPPPPPDRRYSSGPGR